LSFSLSSVLYLWPLSFFLFCPLIVGRPKGAWIQSVVPQPSGRWRAAAAQLPRGSMRVNSTFTGTAAFDGLAVRRASLRYSDNEEALTMGIYKETCGNFVWDDWFSPTIHDTNKGGSAG
jgi:hypothetical protein